MGTTGSRKNPGAAEPDDPFLALIEARQAMPDDTAWPEPEPVAEAPEPARTRARSQDEIAALKAEIAALRAELADVDALVAEKVSERVKLLDARVDEALQSMAMDAAREAARHAVREAAAEAVREERARASFDAEMRRQRQQQERDWAAPRQVSVAYPGGEDLGPMHDPRVLAAAGTPRFRQVVQQIEAEYAERAMKRAQGNPVMWTLADGTQYTDGTVTKVPRQLSTDAAEPERFWQQLRQQHGDDAAMTQAAARDAQLAAMTAKSMALAEEFREQERQRQAQAVAAEMARMQTQGSGG